MGRVFGVVRPYPSGIRRKVFSFLSTEGLSLGEGLVVAPGTTDELAALWVQKHASKMDLLLLPFHLHRSDAGVPVDGIGVASLLPRSFDDAGALPIIMPCSKFSFEAAFQRRISALAAERPLLAERIVVMTEHNIGDPEIRRWLKDTVGRSALSLVPPAEVPASGRSGIARSFEPSPSSTSSEHPQSGVIPSSGREAFLQAIKACQMQDSFIADEDDSPVTEESTERLRRDAVDRPGGVFSELTLESPLELWLEASRSRRRG